jgi:hypothetical protein
VVAITQFEDFGKMEEIENGIWPERQRTRGEPCGGSEGPGTQVEGREPKPWSRVSQKTFFWNRAQLNSQINYRLES